MSKIVENPTMKKYLNADGSAKYVETQGPKMSASGIRNAAYRSRKLGRPKIINGVAYWTHKQLDDWIESL